MGHLFPQSEHILLTLLLQVSGGVLGPDHDKDLDTLVGLLDKDLPKGFLADGTVRAPEELQLVPHRPPSDADELLRPHQGVVEVPPAGARVVVQLRRHRPELAVGLKTVCVLPRRK